MQVWHPSQQWLFASLLVAENAKAQPSSASNPNRTVNLNYVYAADLGFGGYSLAGLTAGVYTLPLSDTLHDVTVRGLGAAAPDAHPGRPLQLQGKRHLMAGASPLTSNPISIVPGAELQVPLSQRTVLKPFAQFGEAHAFGAGVGNPDSWIYLAGVTDADRVARRRLYIVARQCRGLRWR